jgi:DNA-binding MarR family transcriptional regulator
MIYADNYITRSDIANRIGISVTAVQKHINKLKSLRFIDRDGSTGHGSWIIIGHIITVEGRSLIRTFLAGATKDATISSRALSKL